MTRRILPPAEPVEEPAKMTMEQLATLERLASLQCTWAELAAVLGVSIRTLYDWRQIEPRIDVAVERGQRVGLMGLRRKQFALAEKSAGMAIFLGKNYLGQRDVQEFLDHRATDGGPDPAEQKNLDALTVDELKELERLVAKSQPKPKPAAPGAEGDQEETGRRESRRIH
jgi:hypothetical protein